MRSRVTWVMLLALGLGCAAAAVHERGDHGGASAADGPKAKEASVFFSKTKKAEARPIPPIDAANAAVETETATFALG